MLETLNKTLRYGSEDHKTILEALKARKKMSADRMADRHEAWTQSEESSKAYINLKEEDRLRKNNRKGGKPEYVTLEIPYSYGLLMAAHTYWSNTFLSRNPVLQYTGRHGEGSQGEQSVESIMNYQANVGNNMVPWFYWLFDTPKYGVGWIGHYWYDEKISVSNIIEVDDSAFGTGGKTKKVKRTIEVDGYKGNKCFNVRPQDAFPDPRVSVARFQEGEFFARYFETSWLDLHEGALNKRYMNIDVVKRKWKAKKDDPDRDLGSTNFDIPNIGDGDAVDLGIPYTGFVSGIEIYVHLIPKMWKLGSGERRELWVFQYIEDCLVLARPLGDLHNEFPFDAMEYEIDSHSLFKRSMLETVQPLNDAINWLVNTHFFGVRAALNNRFIYDPTKIRGADFENPEQGLLVRMKPGAYGQPINQMVQQLNTTDVTQNHIKDTKVMQEFMQQITGVNELIMGMMQQGGRQTATEVRGASGFSMSRLKTQAEFMSAMGFGPHAKRLLQTTQQHLDIERAYKLAGDLLPGSAQDVIVSPEQIAGFYDYIPVDGTMPVDRFAQASLWKDIMAQMSVIPQIAQQYDLAQIFAYTAQLAGAKNVQRFKIQLTPDEEIARKVQAGNIVPLGGQGGGGRSPGINNGDATGPAVRAAGPRQTSGVGPVS